MREIPSGSPSSADCLSPRELEVFRLLGQGHSTREVAALLGLRPSTAGSHRSQIKRKLGLENSIQLLCKATEFVLRESGGPLSFESDPSSEGYKSHRRGKHPPRTDKGR
ncbi:MAG: helix-turn-helix transcriptional regulator [Lentisphaerae bacterium]|nr:helix-turn-helix transcriptional regulator [Lentisphaerota bacterium]